MWFVFRLIITRKAVTGMSQSKLAVPLCHGLYSLKSSDVKSAPIIIVSWRGIRERGQTSDMGLVCDGGWKMISGCLNTGPLTGYTGLHRATCLQTYDKWLSRPRLTLADRDGISDAGTDLTPSPPPGFKHHQNWHGCAGNSHSPLIHRNFCET